MKSLARVRRRGRYEPFDDDLSNVEPLMFQNPEEIPKGRRSQRSSVGSSTAGGLSTGCLDGMRESLHAP